MGKTEVPMVSLRDGQNEWLSLLGQTCAFQPVLAGTSPL